MSAQRQPSFPAAWPFAVPRETRAFSTLRVTDEGEPILLVYHDHEGDWQFHTGIIEAADEPSLRCLDWFFQFDPSIGLVAQLPLGWVASRESAESPWKLEPFWGNGDGAEQNRSDFPELVRLRTTADLN